MKFDVTGNNIILIQYPAGGFGHFLYHILTEFADETVKIDNAMFELDDNGSCHSTKRYTNSYRSAHERGELDYDNSILVEPLNKKILILCDAGIEGDNLSNISALFTNATIIRVTIPENIRPIIYQTCMLKAVGHKDLFDDAKLHIHTHWDGDSTEPYAIREFYTLFYHNWQWLWEPKPNVINLDLDGLIFNTFDTIADLISSLDMNILHHSKLNDYIDVWKLKNKEYFSISEITNEIMHSLNNNTFLNISHITDLHTQGYINYKIETMYNVTIPVYDYKHWFSTTLEIGVMISNLKHEKIY